MTIAGTTAITELWSKVKERVALNAQSDRNMLAACVKPDIGGVQSEFAEGLDRSKWYTYHYESTLTRTSNGIRIDHAGGANGGIVIPLVENGALAPGETLTLSFDYRGNSTNLGLLYVLCDPRPNAAQGSYTDYLGLDDSGEWAHYERTFEYDANANTPWALLISYYNSAGKWLEIKDGSMMLERGGYATRITELESIEVGKRRFFSSWDRETSVVQLGYLGTDKWKYTGQFQDFSKDFCMRVDFARSEDEPLARHCLASSYGVINPSTGTSRPGVAIELVANSGIVRVYFVPDEGNEQDFRPGNIEATPGVWTTVLLLWDSSLKTAGVLVVDESGFRGYSEIQPSGSFTGVSGEVFLGADARKNDTWNCAYPQRDMPAIWYEDEQHGSNCLCFWDMIESSSGDPRGVTDIACVADLNVFNGLSKLNLAKTMGAIASPTAYGALDFYLSEPLESGQEYVLQLWDVNVSHSAKTADTIGVYVYYCGGSVCLGGWYGTSYFDDGHADRLELHFTPYQYEPASSKGGNATPGGSLGNSSVANAKDKYIRLYNSPPTATGTRNLTVGKWKLEKGDRATDWIPEESQPNLTPWFSAPVTDTLYWYTVDGRGEPATGSEGTDCATNGDDGWAHIVMDSRESAGNDGSSGLYMNMHVKKGYLQRYVRPAGVYTWLIEVKNLNFIPKNATDVLQISPSIGNTTMDVLGEARYYTTENGEKRMRVIAKTGFSSLSRDSRGYCYIKQGCFAEFDLRVSLYEGVYDGPYKPYSGEILYPPHSDGVEYIVGTQTAATGAWTGETRDSVLYEGKHIAYKLPVAGSGNASLNLTLADGSTTGAKAIYHVYSTSSNSGAVGRVSTHWPAESIIPMVYDGTRWMVENYNTNSESYIARYEQYYNVILFKSAVRAASIVGMADTGYIEVQGGVTVDLSYPLLWCTGAVAAGATDYNHLYTRSYDRNLATCYNFFTGTANKMVYLVGTLSGKMLTVDSSNFLTCTEPATEDGKAYIPIGRMSNSTTGKNYCNYAVDVVPAIFAYVDGAFRQVVYPIVGREGGDYKITSKSSMSVATSTLTNLQSVVLPSGTWQVTGLAIFGSNATGVRVAKLSTVSADADDVPSQENIVPVSGVATRMSVSRTFSLSEPTTVYLVGRHTGGTSLTCEGLIEAVKVGYNVGSTGWRDVTAEFKTNDPAWVTATDFLSVMSNGSMVVIQGMLLGVGNQLKIPNAYSPDYPSSVATYVYIPATCMEAVVDGPPFVSAGANGWIVAANSYEGDFQIIYPCI